MNADQLGNKSISDGFFLDLRSLAVQDRHRIGVNRQPDGSDHDAKLPADSGWIAAD